MTLKELQADPGLYAAGQRRPGNPLELYDTHYTERYMGTPQADGEAYTAASAIPEATKITDPLLIIHGMPMTMSYSENATKCPRWEANVPFEMMPSRIHPPRFGEQISPHRYNTVFRFFESHGVTPPE